MGFISGERLSLPLSVVLHCLGVGPREISSLHISMSINIVIVQVFVVVTSVASLSFLGTTVPSQVPSILPLSNLPVPSSEMFPELQELCCRCIQLGWAPHDQL